jgi:hypothetical protein
MKEAIKPIHGDVTAKLAAIASAGFKKNSSSAKAAYVIFFTMLCRGITDINLYGSRA